MAYAIYLRRSRADEEAEARGEGETLARHRNALFDLARRQSLAVVEVYQEIASGDTIAARPEMRRLLADVSARKYAGVLCMAVDRLGRGDSMDQGYIMQTFLYSGTKIITPEKTFDPDSPSDFEYFEMRQFFARREYASIKGRMQAGRELATKEGYFVGSRAPYGYRIIPSPDKRSYTLDIIPEQAAIVRQIFAWYLGGMDTSEIAEEAGCHVIAQRLNEMRIPSPRGTLWSESTVRRIIKNPVYIGMVTWSKRKQQFTMQDGQRTATRKINPAPTIAQGIHEPLITKETWERASRMMKLNTKGHSTADRQTAFLFAGLCKCGLCGKAIIRQKNRYNPEHDIVKCSNPSCNNHGAYITTVEKLVIAQLEAWLVAVPSASDSSEPSASERAAQIEKQLSALAAQHERLHDFLEQGIYDVPTFLSRQRILSEKEDALRAQLKGLESAPTLSPEEAIRRLAPQIRSVLDAYSSTPTIGAKNVLLKTIISRIVYSKPARRYKNDSEFTGISIDIFPVNP